jgi:prevent-host-death family protein
MTIHVNIAEAKARLSALVEAALSGEDVILQKSGVPKARIVPIEEADQARRAEIARRRVANIGKFKEEFAGFDVSIEALKAERGDPEERFRRKFGPAR